MQDWHPQDVRAEIRKRGGTLSSLAKQAGVSKQALGAAIDHRASEPIEHVIADFLDLKPHQIWPSRYNAKGRRIRYRSTRDTQVAA
ncbi:helix-turn-helix domain-containing protein [Sphingopyxis sp. FD7]|uniref:helix-turn-helix domain-containing protein n=1 Tax=Sphingopyxis sp. FD7 TaxID=1914525 RepID=UPI000DC627D9|nr:helix-turn-helix domain-containing protein [Sphingopyxis sp. FD7]BBB13439.1 putative DNA-binding protein [Sphingopyxis sp. FD7]